MTAIPDFGSVELGRPASAATHDDWAKAFKEATGRGVEEATWETPEGIAVPPLATPADLAVDGVDGYVFAGCDALSVLRTAHEQLGVQS